MKLLLIILVAITSSKAFSWDALISCDYGDTDKGAFVIDTGPNDSMGRPTFQWVLRGAPLSYFVRQNAIPRGRVNTKGEFVDSLYQYDSQFMSYSPIVPGAQMIYLMSYVSGDVYLRANVDNRAGVSVPVSILPAEWQFHNCWHR